MKLTRDGDCNALTLPKFTGKKISQSGAIYQIIRGNNGNSVTVLLRRINYVVRH